ncbi:MAG: glutamine synthetase adenylyltransferase, partial [Chloroflexi bacterium]|nr:glutamine synthetase adenylyltransferase [Chloroflexota bacterium]
MSSGDLAAAIEAALAGSASPDRALVGITRFLQRLPADSPAVRALLARPRFAQGLATLFAGSPFLGEILLQHPEDAEALLKPDGAAGRRRPSQHLHAALAAVAPLTEPAAQLDALRRLQRIEYLRIGYADLLGLWDLAAVTGQLSALAEGLIRAVLSVCARSEGVSAHGFAVLAMGKLGGGELNYSSDVDLVFVAEHTDDARIRLAQAVVDGLARSTVEGHLYRVDLRLRPWGRTGPLVAGVEGYIEYLRSNARPWERQALLRARAVAGDQALGEGFLWAARPLLFGAAQDAVRRQVAAAKRHIDDGLRARGRDWGEVKSGSGSIRDVEFLVQYLQLAHGATRPEILAPNTPEALRRLRTAGLLP